ncbi:hypothetical protein ACQX3I_11975, partial [Corynebacterium diphtheriae]
QKSEKEETGGHALFRVCDLRPLQFVNCPLCDVHDGSSARVFKKRIPSCGYGISRELTTPTPLLYWHKYSLKIIVSPVGDSV